MAALPAGGRWWLDSARAGFPLGRFSFAGFSPYACLRAFGDRCELRVLRGVRPDLPAPPGSPDEVEPSGDARALRDTSRAVVGVVRRDPLQRLRELLPPAAACGVDLPFAGGALVALGYDLARQLDAGAPAPAPLRAFPDLVALFVDRVLAFDHLDGRLWAVGTGFADDPDAAHRRAREAAESMVACGECPVPDVPPGSRIPAPALETVEPADYAKRIDEVRHHIAAGDVYQACLTRRRIQPAREPGWPLYWRLRRANPAPFGAYLELPGVTVLGSSPERFLRVSPEGRVESRPIKGTRPRHPEPRRDAALRAELAASPKDRAENLMIVDLVRNDLGRVCETGSVHVSELMAIEAYQTVFQMVSTVRGRLAPGCDALDAVRAAFPPGSMTGAPKLAAMHLLARLETAPRGLYAGALGYLDPRGGCDLAVVIRTGLLWEGQLHLHTGGGIVADSRADEEWRESEDKLRVLLEALG